MKKFLSLTLIVVLIICTCFAGVITVANAATPSPENHFIAFNGIIEEYTGPGGAVIIPEKIGGHKVTQIGDDSFTSNTTITSLIIPEGVTQIGHRAFKYCTNLKTVILPYTLIQMGTEVFHSTAVTSIIIPPNLKQVPYGTFTGCKNLSDIKLSYGVEEIHPGAFGGTSPSRVIFPETVKIIFGASFNYVNTRGTVELIICNPDCKFGTYIKGGLWGEYMASKYTDDLFRPINATLAYWSENGSQKIFRIIVPENSAVGKFIEEKEPILLNPTEDSGAINNDYQVEYHPSLYFERLPENQEGYGVKTTKEATTETQNSSKNSSAGNSNTSENTTQSTNTTTKTTINTPADTNVNKNTIQGTPASSPSVVTPPPVTEAPDVTETEEQTEVSADATENEAEQAPINIEPQNLSPLIIALYVFAGIVFIAIATLIIVFKKEIFKKKPKGDINLSDFAE